jgi:hypothetical protein
LDRAFFDSLLAEFRTDAVLSFDESDVTRFSIRENETTHAFSRSDDRWTYEAEPDLPLEAAKVDQLLLRIKDLKTTRYVTHLGDDPAAFGLDAPAREVVISLGDGVSLILNISDKSSNAPGGGVFATVTDASGVFLLSQDAVSRVGVILDALEPS